MESKVKKIGVLTSGGDAQGMNACVRAVVRRGLDLGMEVVGIRRGYSGLLNEDFIEMKPNSVSNILQQGGTILLTARCLEMLQPEYQDAAAEICRKNGIEGLVTIGGDGTFRGALCLSERGVNVVGIPGTIDRDIACTDYTIGFDTAVNVVYDAVLKLRDTSNSHERVNVVEVMGRNCGEIAIWAGIATGADYVVIPEDPNTNNLEKIVGEILENRKKGKMHNIIIVAEGVEGSKEMASKIQQMTGIDTRFTRLGHIQRGGRPTALDVKHASMMGAYAVELLARGGDKRVIAFRDGQYVNYDITDALKMTKRPGLDVWETNVHISTY